jgi:hypothetical protein
VKLEKWASSNKEGRFQLKLAVPAGGLQLGKLLIQAMYSAHVDLSGLTQHQLLQMLLLADRYMTAHRTPNNPSTNVCMGHLHGGQRRNI